MICSDPDGSPEYAPIIWSTNVQTIEPGVSLSTLSNVSNYALLQVPGNVISGLVVSFLSTCQDLAPHSELVSIFIEADPPTLSPLNSTASVTAGDLPHLITLDVITHNILAPHALTHTITSLPDTGMLFHHLHGGAVGSQIGSVPAVLSDNTVFFVPPAALEPGVHPVVFSFEVASHSQSVTSSITVEISSNNLRPNVMPDLQIDASRNSPVQFSFVSQGDPNNDSLQFTVSSLPSNGRLFQVYGNMSTGVEITAPGSISNPTHLLEYLANNTSLFGKVFDSLTISASDNSLVTDFQVTFSLARPEPILETSDITVSSDQPIRINLREGLATDVAGPVKYSILSLPSSGSLHTCMQNGHALAALSDPDMPADLDLDCIVFIPGVDGFTGSVSVSAGWSGDGTFGPTNSTFNIYFNGSPREVPGWRVLYTLVNTTASVSLPAELHSDGQLRVLSLTGDSAEFSIGNVTISTADLLTVPLDLNVTCCLPFEENYEANQLVFELTSVSSPSTRHYVDVICHNGTLVVTPATVSSTDFSIPSGIISCLDIAVDGIGPVAVSVTNMSGGILRTPTGVTIDIGDSVTQGVSAAALPQICVYPDEAILGPSRQVNITITPISQGTSGAPVALEISIGSPVTPIPNRISVQGEPCACHPFSLKSSRYDDVAYFEITSFPSEGSIWFMTGDTATSEITSVPAAVAKSDSLCFDIPCLSEGWPLDSFAFSATDGVTTSPPESILVFSAVVSDRPPECSASSTSVTSTVGSVFFTPGLCLDADGDNVNITITSLPSNGSLFLYPEETLLDIGDSFLQDSLLLFRATPSAFTLSDSFTWRGTSNAFESASQTTEISMTWSRAGGCDHQVIAAAEGADTDVPLSWTSSVFTPDSVRFVIVLMLIFHSHIFFWIWGLSFHNHPGEQAKCGYNYNEWYSLITTSIYDIIPAFCYSRTWLL